MFRVVSVAVAVVVMAATGSAQTPPVARVVAPAVYRSGPTPLMPAIGLGGGEVVLELTVNDQGTVTGVRPLRTTAGFTELVVEAVKAWQFTPAEELLDSSVRKPGESATKSVESRVLVATLFRPPALYANATIGEPVRDVERPSDEVPFPISTVTPAFLPPVRDQGVVLTEARVNGAGAVTDAVVKRSWPPFDEAALAAARQWTFRPARSGVRTAPRVYLMFAFRTPVVG